MASQSFLFFLQTVLTMLQQYLQCAKWEKCLCGSMQNSPPVVVGSICLIALAISGRCTAECGMFEFSEINEMETVYLTNGL